MTYKDILKNILTNHYLVSDDYVAKIVLIGLWLEDINYHTAHQTLFEMADITEDDFNRVHSLALQQIVSTYSAITSWGFSDNSGFNFNNDFELAEELFNLVKEVEVARFN